MLGVSDWNWLPTVLSAGVSAAVVSTGLQAWRDRGKGRASATYLALRLAVALEAFAHDCSELIAENSSAEGGGYTERPRYKTQLPAIADFPDDGDGWRALELGIAAECLGLRNAIAVTQSSIGWVLEYAGEDVEHHVTGGALKHGLTAWDVACLLRKTYKLPAIADDIDYVRHLREKHAEYVEEQERRAARRAERDTSR